MLNKKELANKLINNEAIEPYFPDWSEFYGEYTKPKTIKESIKSSYKLYNNWILWKYANGESKEEIKEWLIEQFDMFTKGANNNCGYSEGMLENIAGLLNKYFSIEPEENHIGILDGKKVTYTWNKLFNYELIEPINNIPYQLKRELKDWINHKVNNNYIGKFSVDHVGNIII